MAEKKEELGNWLWIGVIVVSVVAIAFFALKFFGVGAEAEGAYYAEDSIMGLLDISFGACGALALDPAMVQDKKMAYNQHMLGRHVGDMQEALGYAEKFQNTGDPYWKNQYDQKVKAICIHTLDNIQVPRKGGAYGGGGSGSTGNLIPAISDVYTDVGPSTPGANILPV